MSGREAQLEPAGLYRLEPVDDRGRVEAGVYALADSDGNVVGIVHLLEAVDGDVLGEVLLRHEEYLADLDGESVFDRYEVRLTDRTTVRAVVSPRLHLTILE